MTIELHITIPLTTEHLAALRYKLGAERGAPVTVVDIIEYLKLSIDDTLRVLVADHQQATRDAR